MDIHVLRCSWLVGMVLVLGVKRSRSDSSSSCRGSTEDEDVTRGIENTPTKKFYNHRYWNMGRDELQELAKSEERPVGWEEFNNLALVPDSATNGGPATNLPWC